MSFTDGMAMESDDNEWMRWKFGDDAAYAIRDEVSEAEPGAHVIDEEGGVLRDSTFTDEEHAARIQALSHFPSMQARIMEAGGVVIPPTVKSRYLNSDDC